MIKKFLSLEWKQFKRSAAFQQKIAVKIVLGLFALLIIAELIGGGIATYFILEDVFPEDDPFIIVNNYLIYWFLLEMLYRYLLQQLPVVNIKPLMVLPISRKTVINFLIGKSVLSLFNFIPLFFYVPFTIVLLVKGYGYSALAWFAGMLLITCAINFINFLVNKNSTFFGFIAALLAVMITLWYTNIFDATPYIGSGLHALYTTPYLLVVPLLAVILLYVLIFQFLDKNFYLDGVVRKRVKEVEAADLSFLNKFGKLAPFLKNDLKMIWRNKRPKQVLFLSFLFLFYGIIFFSNSVYENQVWIKPFAAVFVTGGFLMTFGQNVPSWDSEYYKLMMSQNIRYKTYLESKWLLMVVFTIISAILSIPYVYFGMDILLVILAGALFNIGLNTYLNLLGGVFNKTVINLNERNKAFSNTQAFNASQFLIAIPKMGLPILFFFVPYLIMDSWMYGVAGLAVSGLLGLMLKNPILSFIEKQYQKEKYKAIAAYSDK
ncbi:hypothetical protein SAMN05216480_101149 [Pustulibacterium marinum]|uniref:ABC-2 type transport system permease protein n=1 Tax=Pustulibacterium marinum TaxID=1224947 RepID=A0A1I7ETW0_9FLAO|nr:DUF5687 family protein [Pustulibacterium marinum]SFU27365.1 hypothetical protein SAMN05216480_101149 [Pustulibacterium marinum]